MKDKASDPIILKLFFINTHLLLLLLFLKSEFNCQGETTEKHETFSVPITKKVKRIGQYRDETTKNRSYKLKFIDTGKLTSKSCR